MNRDAKVSPMHHRSSSTSSSEGAEPVIVPESALWTNDGKEYKNSQADGAAAAKATEISPMGSKEGHLPFKQLPFKQASAENVTKLALRTFASANPEGRIHASKAPNCRARLWACVDTPSSSKCAQIFSIFIMALILISVVTFCLETLPEFHKKNMLFWFTIETFCIAIFTAEFLLRIASAPNTCKFMYDIYTIIDIGAIFPYYLEVGIDLQDGVMFNVSEASFSAAFLRVFRLLRVLRVFKMARYLSWMKLFTVSIKQSLPPLGMFLFFVAIVITVFACFIYYLEKGVWLEVNGNSMYVVASGPLKGTPSQFGSIPEAMYWCIITMTTVGYGDMYPLTTSGKLVAAAASLTGIFVLAIPITIISSNFNREYERDKKERAEAHAKMQMLRNHFRRRKTGFSTLADEIENMVTHKTAQYKKKVVRMIDASRSELIDEIEELVRLAYDTRVKYDKVNANTDTDEDEAVTVLNRNSSV